MMKRASGGDAAAGAGSERAGATRVLGRGREGGHSVDSIGLPRRASACCAEPAQTSEWLGSLGQAME